MVSQKRSEVKNEHGKVRLSSGALFHYYFFFTRILFCIRHVPLPGEGGGSRLMLRTSTRREWAQMWPK